jgi:hypothetical protein
MTTLLNPHVSMCDPSDNVLTLVRYPYPYGTELLRDIIMRDKYPPTQVYAMNNSFREFEATKTHQWKSLVEQYQQRKSFEDSLLMIENKKVRNLVDCEGVVRIYTKKFKQASVIYCPIFPYTTYLVDRMITARVIHYLGCFDHAQEIFLERIRQRAAAKNTKIEHILWE